MSSILNGLMRGYQAQIQRYRNRPFLRAAMAGCALVSMADRVVSLQQRTRVDQILETLDALRLFDPHEGVDLFNEFVEAIRIQQEAGHALALTVLDQEVAEEPDKARLLMRICAAVSEEEGVIHPPEWRELHGLCLRYGIEPHHCGLGAEPEA